MMRFTFILICFAFVIRTASGQQAAGQDSTRLNAATRYALAMHNQVSTSLEHLYNGPEYVGYDRRMTGHAFFPADSLIQGRVAYEGGQFTVPMLYDIVKDVLVVVHPSGYRIALHSDRVPYFSLNNHQFIRLDSTEQQMPGGFYDQIYTGPTQLLARRTKVILAVPTTVYSATTGGIFGQFDPKTSYYVRRNGAYVQVKNKRALLSLLADRRKELTSFARKQRLNFRPSPEAAFIQLVQQYDALTKPL